MGKKNKGGKKKVKHSGKSAGPAYEKIEIPNDGVGWVKINVKLVNWTFDNMSITINTSRPLYSIVRKIKEKHGNVNELSLYKGQVNDTNLLQDFDASLQSMGFEGAEKIEDAKVVNIYYDFKPILNSSPLLLVTPRST